MRKSAEPNSDRLKAEFRQKLEKYEVAPSESLWERLDLSLEKEAAAAYKNRMRIYARLAAACLLLLVAFSLVFVSGSLQPYSEQDPRVVIFGNITDQEQAPMVAENATPADNRLPKNAIASGKKVQPSAPGKEMTEPDLEQQGIGTTGTETGELRLQAEEPLSALTDNEARHEARDQEHGVASKNSVPLIAAATSAVKSTAPELNTLSGSNTSTVSAGKLNTGSAYSPEIKTGITASAAKMAIASTEGADGNNIGKQTADSEQASESAGSLARETKGQPQEIASALVSENNPLEGTGDSPGESREDAFAAIKDPAIFEEVIKLPALISLTRLDSVLAGTQQEETKKDKPLKNVSRWAVKVAYAGSSFDPGMRLASQVDEVPPVKDNFGSSLILPSPHARKMQSVQQYHAAIDEFNHNTKAVYSFRVSVLADYKLTEYFSLQSGLHISQNRAVTSSTYLFQGRGTASGALTTLTAGPEQETILQTVMGQEYEPFTRYIQTEAFEVEYRYYYVGVPLNLRFQLGNKAFRYFAATGISLNQLMRAETRNKHAEFGNVAVEKGFYRQMMPTAMLQLGIGYKVAERLQLETALEGTRNLRSLIEDVQVAGRKQHYGKGLGASVGLSYSF
ncbi:outer membrane beta-barrel protein [Adhaeribacter soli]|uniref:Outer membrane beta-barrel protein n=1 Tax=Adhaeribacter soli TaxID=2607655 RepID=A0A5N1J0Z0_9BACT|nr:outer membrane beta-barrel protein [Adhaeribacter soli]KAA9340068.1 outer membrane beta-barrel protein [Adhaeribacter soli]